MVVYLLLSRILIAGRCNSDSTGKGKKILIKVRNQLKESDALVESEEVLVLGKLLDGVNMGHNTSEGS